MEGMEHAKCIARRLSADKLKAPKVVYTSPYLRTAHTAQLIALDLPNPCIRVEEGLTEWLTPSLLVEPDLDRRIPQSVEQLAQKFGTIDLSYSSLNPVVQDDELKIPLGAPHFPETQEDLMTRCATTMDRLLEHQQTQNFAIVSHAPCNQALALHLEGAKSIEQSQLGPWPVGGVTLFSREIHGDGTFGKWEMEACNSTSHLPGKYKYGLKGWSLPCLARQEQENLQASPCSVRG